MGKPTGFLEYQRTENPSSAPKERIQDYHEFHPPLSAEERQKQGARCMNCGVPFCQSALVLKGMVTGCPLHNLIPEWNDEVYHGNFSQALWRLRKTNNFPEFTGRVCPALCEKACICGLNDDPVTIKDNELFIIETGFASGNMQPVIPPVRTGKTVAVIGSGPAGLAVADQLNQRGHQVTVFEREDRPGGLLMYGIPNMKLDKSIVLRRLSLMETEGIRFVTNADVGKNIDAKKILKDYDAVVLCCGSKKPRDLVGENRQVKGIYFAVDFLTAATKHLMDQTSPISAKGKKVVIVGGGDTGNDCVGTCIRQGCTSVTQIEMMPKLPDERLASNPWPEWPRICKTDYGQEEACALFGHDPRIYETTVKEFLSDEKGHLTGIRTVNVRFENGKMTEVKDSEQIIEADLLLIAAGFTGCEDYITDAFQLERTARGTISTAPSSFAAGKEKVFTAGDVRRGQSLVVWAIAEGRQCAREVDQYLMGYTNM
ncbi:glutamate synthase subunit beta [Claveliimonas bilis]|uniref:glutamate synthase subunit beta n=1 Tax=Claveliimonas bilis TaxID=3028070 RepID=UPI001E3CDAA7|nr:glutamate synthase subunit beta [Claveliimonas bilis]BCZ28545.1 glutamate synthase subunit beta [Claveliimonas bilis]